MSRPILLAGTRLTGEKLHIGTYYGWLHQIKEAQNIYDVILIISDFQSFDLECDCESYHVAAVRLKNELKKYLPSTPIIIESEIPNIVELGFCILKFFKKRYFKRVIPIRQQIENNMAIPFHTLLYPSMMIADIIALNASLVFDKPEGKFQHSEVINCVINDINRHYDVVLHPPVKVYHKKKINILSLDGSGPMKRNREMHGIIELGSLQPKYIYESLLGAASESVESIKVAISFDNSIEFNGSTVLWRMANKICLDIEASEYAQCDFEHEILPIAMGRVNNAIEIMRREN